MMMGTPSLHQIAAVETQRSSRTGRGFSLLRIAPEGFLALEEEMDVLERFVQQHLRATDFVSRVRPHEVGALLLETIGEGALVPLARLRGEAAEKLPKLRLQYGWASVGPGHGNTWQEAWRWAGRELLGDAARAAA